MTREKFQRKWYFFYEKESRFNPRLIHKSRFLIRKVPIEKYGLKNSVFAIQHIENRKSFIEVLSSFTFHTSYKNGMIGGGGGGGGEHSQNAQKHFSIKTF